MAGNDDLVVLRPEGLYCAAGDFHIDPWRPVPRAVITHGHGDHARPGMGEYHCSEGSLPILRWRLGDVQVQAHAEGVPFGLGRVQVSLHPAGHVLGSSQVRIDDGRQVWVASGDYKRQPDPTCAPFEVVPCDTFITEATFALPIYRWPDTPAVAAEIVAWRRECEQRGEAAILLCYALGKAQRVLAELLPLDDRPAWLHGAIANGVAVYRQAGVPLLETHTVAEQGRQPDAAGQLILAPPSAAGTPWMRRFGRHQLGFASGWMQLRGNRRRRNVDRGFVISDHADWPALLQTIEQTGARRVIATHGNTDALIPFLRERGVAAEAFRTDFRERGMKAFAALYQRLDRSTATLDKRAALVDYFRQAGAHDAAWALYLLSGGKVGGARRKIAASGELRAWIADASGLPPWLVEDSYAQVGDLAETLTLLLDDPKQPAPDRPLAEWIEQHLLAVANQPEPVRRAAVVAGWTQLCSSERLVFNKLLTGALRVGVSQRLVQQALAEWSGLDIARIAQRMLGEWVPSPGLLAQLLSPDELPLDRQQPYPFFLASPLESEPAERLGPIGDWLLEWKWDGIRLQLLRRRGEVALWSRGEERLDGRFPEIEQAAMALPDGCVLDGELLAWDEAANLPRAFTALQTRIQRRKPGAATLRNTPVRVLAYDLLEQDGVDLRELPLQERRTRLASVLGALADARIQLSPEVAADDWPHAAALRDVARERGVEGLMLKRRLSAYQAGRRRGDWWKWKVDPLTIDAVLLYAQAGHGRRSTLYTDYTFGVWDGETLVPVAKAYSGLDDKEILALDRWIRANTRERFGPVRSVRAEQVFELGFEAVNRSSRHKSGIAVRFPRILRWRQDKPASEADQLATLQALAR